MSDSPTVISGNTLKNKMPSVNDTQNDNPEVSDDQAKEQEDKTSSVENIENDITEISNNQTDEHSENIEQGNTEEKQNDYLTNESSEEQTLKTALINETTYPTISEAIASANSGDTIKVLENITQEEEINIDSTKNIILNLNGKTITSTAINTIKNQGTLTITGNGIIKNEVENGTVINNAGVLNMENGVITTEKNGGKCVKNMVSETNSTVTFNMKAGKILTQGIGAIGIYNSERTKTIIEDGIINVTGFANKAIYNNSELEIIKGKVIVSKEDGIGIYNSKTAQVCNVGAVEILIEAEEIKDYELIKDTDEFKKQLEEMKPSYGIYNDSEKNVTLEEATIKVERLKGVGIKNNAKGEIILGKEDEEYNSATPIIYAIADNTTALQNSENGKIDFYDGRFITHTSIKSLISKVLEKYEIIENLNEKNIVTLLNEIVVDNEINDG